MTYEELKKKHQDEVNNFPLGFAFGNKQFEEMMKDWNLDPEKDLDKIVSLGAGAFLRKQDVPAYKEMSERFEKELKEFRKDEKNFIDALVYQLHNHEYGYSRSDDDIEAALAAIGLSWEDVDAQDHPFNHKCLIQAERRCIKEYDETN